MARFPRGSWLTAGAVFVVLAAVGGRYGYHRDELYFIEAGHHPAWGYPDQPALIPLLAAGWDHLVGDRLWAFRLVPALLAALVVLVASATSERLGGRRRDQVGTAVATATSAVVLATGRLFSTTTFDLLLTATEILLLLWALEPEPDQAREPGSKPESEPESKPGPGWRGGRLGRWLLVGAVAAVDLEVKVLLALVLLSTLIGLLIAGPRAPLRRAGVWLAALIAAAGAAPNLIWQATNGWPQLTMSQQIAAGSSGTSVSRPLVIPLQLLIIGPILSIVLVVGVIALLGRPHLRAYRWVVVTYAVLLLLIVIVGGKPYYAAGLVPVLLAAGVPPVLDFVAHSRIRRGVAGVLLAAHVCGVALITLPLAAPGSATFAFVNGVNPDVGETVGWDRFAQVARDISSHSDGAAILTANYGEAGAVDRLRRQGGWAPPVYSGHNAYGEWGPPPESVQTVVLIGDFSNAEAWFTSCTPPMPYLDPVNVDNDEHGVPIRICRGPRRPWAQLWPQIRHLG
jgi:4-amino-4-deoxy-L-arabinose transferase-like glycosyltransferase